jgi:hypothetical protein
MSIAVVASGTVTESPCQVGTDHGPVTAFVLDPFPNAATSELAHGAEVVFRDHESAGAVLDEVKAGDTVLIQGQLLLLQVAGPLEDDLAAVRVRIEASRVRLHRTTKQPCSPN